MPTTINLQTSFDKQIELVFSVQEFLAQFLPGVPMVDRNKNPIPNSTIQAHINRAVALLEKVLNIKIQKTYIEEDMDFTRDDWYKWTYIHTHFPVVCAFSLLGFVGNVQQITYPPEWLSVRKTNDGFGYYRRINIIPNNGGTAQTVGVLFSGIYPTAGYLNMNGIPNYWKLKYVTGWDAWEAPGDLLTGVGIMASLSLLSVISFGMSPLFGISTESLSLDGLSQSISSLQNSNTLLFGPLLKQYKEQMSGTGGLLDMLSDIYCGIIFAVG